MSIFVGNDRATQYHGDHHPAELWGPDSKGKTLVRYAGYDIPKVSGQGRVEIGEQPYKAALPSVVVHGEGEQDSYSEIPTKAGSVVTFDGLDEGRTLKAVTQIAVRQEGSGDPSPENPRPIVATDKVELVRCGENLLDSNQMVLSSSNVYFKPKENAPMLKKGVTYTLTTNVLGKQVTGLYLEEAYTGKELKTSYDVVSFTYTPDHDVRIWAALYCQKDSRPEDMTSLQMFVGSAVTPYTPYTGQTYTAQLPPDTYGGEVDWEKGEVTPIGVLRSYRVSEMNNNEDFPGWIDYSLDQDVGVMEHNTDYYITNSNIDIPGKTRFQRNSRNRVYSVKSSWGGLSQSEIKAKYPDLTVQVIIPFAPNFHISQTPISTSGTPTALPGVNTLYSDSGDTTVSGREDPIATLADQQAQIDALKKAIIATGGNV